MLLLHKLQKKVVDLTTKSFTMKKQATSNKQQATLKFRFKSLLFPLFFYMLIPLFSKSQIISNLVWNHVDGISEPYSITKSLTDKQGNTITIATKVVPSEDANISVIKFDRSGSIIWQQSYNGISNAKDYATNLYIDDNYNIFVCGTSYDSTTLYDMLVLKYDSAGTLEITMQYDGPANGDDIATAVGLDGGGRIYVTGSSTVSGNMTDFVTVKYQTDGTFDWEAFYDYANGYEVPIGIEFKHDYSSMYISGASASSLTNWDYATINYDLSGTQLGAVRSSSAGIGFDNPMGFFIDSLNNIYITGSAIDSGTTTYNIKTMKLDSALNILWTKTYDEDHMNDQGNDIAVDDYGNVYVTGYVMAGNDSSNIAILKYDAAGNLIWSKNFNGKDSNGNDIGKKIVIEGNRIFVSGVFVMDGNTNIGTFQLDSSGQVMWMDVFDGLGNGLDEVTSLTITSDHFIYVSGLSFDGISNKNITLCYKLMYENFDNVDYLVDSTKFLKNQIVFKLKPELINTEFANNKKWQFAKLNEIVADSIVSIIANNLGYEYAGDFYAIKIFDWMIKDDSISTARNGLTFIMDKLWSTYRLLLHESLDESIAVDSLNTLPNYIEYAHLINFGSLQSIQNDPYIIDQNSLHAGSVGIKMLGSHASQGAWDIEVGKPFVKVGIIDQQISHYASDFKIGLTDILGHTKVVDGKDFFFGYPMWNWGNGRWHGTCVAGIIGALRNNKSYWTPYPWEGIAGIAGGDWNQMNPGVSLVCAKTFISLQSPNFMHENAIAWCANNSLEGGKCHIINCSFGTSVNNQTLDNVLKFAFENHCVIVASRGNWYDDINQNAIGLSSATAPFFPATSRKEWVISVGASGNDGKYKTKLNGDAEYNSGYGRNVDLIAPGSTDIVLTTNNEIIPPFGYEYIPNGEYSTFTGTSASAAHVSGVASLLLSHHVGGLYPNALDDGDVQHLIKKYADATGEIVEKVGSGKLNAFNALKYADIPHGYWIQHANDAHITSTNYTTVDPGILIEIENYVFEGLLPNHQYKADKIEITRTYSVTLPNFAVSPVVIDQWITHNSGASPIFTDLSEPESYADISNIVITGNVLTATVKTYVYKITHDYILNQLLNYPRYYPDYTPNVSTNVSFHMFDNIGNLDLNDKEDNDIQIVIFPNPCQDYFYYRIEKQFKDYLKLTVFNILGEIVLSQAEITSTKSNSRINTKHLPPGIYHVVFETGTSKYSTALFITSN
jgi:hypothetical protein